jgi:hypothetical protein
MIPPTLYAQSRGADIAYKILGDGLRDIVMSPAFASHLDAFWELPENAEFLDRLSGLGRLTDTVRSLTMGSPVSCEPAGQHLLKGVPGRWPLHRLTASVDIGADQANA